ncbi:MAG TPA: DEAD/DEAH box helicase, partial [Candidatus Cybelea sp.]|nr:DEAD/DEAH box helicase [Candidatus Cybelea sp.]
DCRSTYLLREWLLARRLEGAAAFGIDFPFYEHRSSAPSLQMQEEESRRSDLERQILEKVLLPKSEEEYELMSDERRARYLIGGLLAYHTREAKPQWWAYFDRCENIDDLLEFDREPIAGLRLCEHISPKEVKRSKVYTYTFPEQHHKMGPGNAENPRTRGSVAIVSIDDERNLLELRTGAPIEGARAIKELIPPRPPAAKPQRDAIERIAKSFLMGDLSRRYPAANSLLLRRPPRLAGVPRGQIQPAEVDAASITKIADALDGSYLFVQGPPGSGKSTYGSSVICDLLAAGKRVAVTSTSHTAIHNLLHKVESSMQERGLGFRGRYKHSSSNEGSEFRSKLRIAMIDSIDSNEAFVGEGYDLAGGTAWLLAREELEGQFDYLFIDEAGQVALADALALSLCARNVVLLGDPSQLAQVSQGRHLLHVGDSVLEHLLASGRTVPKDRGIFLDVSYRMQSDICAFVSDAMYEGRLRPSPSATEHHVPMGDRRLAGLYFAPVEHSGNSSSSLEEAAEVVARISRLAAYERDIIVVTPYNAQRRLIASKLAEAGHDHVRVGTVDKFQGQEAAVVFYSMATSSGEEMPRDMEFLFERNRFNVAISRARAASILVCSPRLLDVSCRTPAEMSLVNLLCAFKERAAAAEW